MNEITNAPIRTSLCLQVMDPVNFFLQKKPLWPLPYLVAVAGSYYCLQEVKRSGF